jgi:hypothetical protein
MVSTSSRSNAGGDAELALTAPERGYFSVVRWRPDATRDEARNVAVILVDAEGQFGGVRVAPPSALSSESRQQGLMDSILHGLERQFELDARPDLARLREITEALSQSLYVTEPKPTAVPDPDLTLQALYKAYVAPISFPRQLTKAVVIDKVVNALRKRGYGVRRSEYVGDFVFDALVDSDEGLIAFDVLSFGQSKKDWTPAEHDAGHFLYGLERVNLPGVAVIQPPIEGHEEAQVSFERVRHWFEDADVPVRRPDEVTDPQVALFET